ncbi:IscS subfamily cysteine desulfurase [Candidatus Sneabacter namystus]|uniref:Cysteine desulfurase n=2 Tax=Candidatus Sneabacter namystus TaxID=2601646 RepID=A0A5C0UJB0_9RICK|nr:IscS subfamily cysteine desulfurase [Candidatus Sneabacter namystus]
MDYQSTTPLAPGVLDVMMPFFVGKFGNPHSKTHVFGHAAENVIEPARTAVADVIGARSKEIVFTSGATEANNMAIKGVAYFYRGKKNHIVVLQTEHKCVMETCRFLEHEGWEVSYVPVQTNGLVDLNVLESSIRQDTVIVSVMAINNETGVIQPLEEIGKICRRKGTFFHSDIAQAFGKIPIDVEKLNLDLASISSHKIYGPKGIGALYVRRRAPRVRIVPVIHGGGQEYGMRSGTLSPALVVGFGEAARIALANMYQDSEHVKLLYKTFTDIVTSNIPEVVINGDLHSRYYGNANVSFAYVEGESLILAMRNCVAVSSGSACTSGSLESSYVLRAMGVREDLAHTSIRFGFGRYTSLEEVEYVAKKLIPEVERLRQMSPLWEMVKEGVDLNTVQWSSH